MGDQCGLSFKQIYVSRAYAWFVLNDVSSDLVWKGYFMRLIADCGTKCIVRFATTYATTKRNIVRPPHRVRTSNKLCCRIVFISLCELHTHR